MSAGTLPHFMRNDALTTACAAFSFVVPASRGVPVLVLPLLRLSRCLSCGLIAFGFLHILYTPPLMAIICSALSLSLVPPFSSSVEWTLVHWT